MYQLPVDVFQSDVKHNHQIPDIHTLLTLLEFSYFLLRPLIKEMELSIFLSFGFPASTGIVQYKPNFVAPGIRPSVQRTCILLTIIPHFSYVCFIDKYSIIISP